VKNINKDLPGQIKIQENCNKQNLDNIQASESTCLNLYKQVFANWLQTDTKEGIDRYFLAENDRKAYDKVYPIDCSIVDIVHDHSVTHIKGDRAVYYINGEAYPDTLTVEDAINIVVENRGELFMEGKRDEEFYHGKTYKGWELIKENITQNEIRLLMNLGIVS